ncbi:hypothetical protein diail_10830 [Diaporthe ilicicola]|nr:hypothetical protein diail_10830 [Diaporthe ilicicola]
MAFADTKKHVYNLPSDAVWFITGCSSGLGLSLAQLIAAHPTHRLVATARDPSKFKATLPSSSRVLIVALDVTSPESIAAALDTVLRHPAFGRIDVLVNNAGHGLMGDTESSLPRSPGIPNSSDEEHSKARGVVETDFWGTAIMTLHAMRIMREDNSRNGVHFTIAEPGGIDTNYATSSMSTLAKHPAYDASDSPARMLAAYVDNPESRKSWSRPEAMANAIYEVVSRCKPVPVRFPLGTVAWETLRANVNSIVDEFEEIKELSVGVDSTEQAKDVEKVRSLY